ncbi:hypothetical protein [Flammeovirga aprica]|uniref:Uncharacterized protein n=1 Tax=Flammeovirga aprica JL-4 TaxID=694437 RepID=A0A7X9RXN7_9BACT|nr:hypothetical protein [Flammeovirga aprica]NME70564.1 hypothetical protein [Flammeovirga aprica JL-4]
MKDLNKSMLNALRYNLIYLNNDLTEDEKINSFDAVVLIVEKGINDPKYFFENDEKNYSLFIDLLIKGSRALNKPLGMYEEEFKGDETIRNQYLLNLRLHMRLGELINEYRKTEISVSDLKNKLS